MCMERGNSYLKVIDHVESITLKDCKFIVRKAGARQAKVSGVRNVHAFVEGQRSWLSQALGPAIEFTYEPFGSNRFVERKTRKPLDSAKFVHLGSTGAYAIL